MLSTLDQLLFKLIMGSSFAGANEVGRALAESKGALEYTELLLIKTHLYMCNF